MAIVPKSIDYTNKDYESFRAQMMSLIPIKCPEWTDYKESDFGVVIIELLAYCLDILSYYQDRNANEAYIDTAKLRGSVVSLCKLIGYSAKGYYPSEFDVEFSLTEPAPSGGVTIFSGFKVGTLQTETDPPVIFEVKDTVVIPQGEQTATIRVIQGETVYDEILGSSNASQDQIFTLKQKRAVIDGTMIVQVKENGVWVTYTRVDTFVDSTSISRHYRAYMEDNDVTYIEFGNGAAGKVPPAGTDNIRSTYRTCDGSSGNVGRNSITQVVGGEIPLLTSVNNPSDIAVSGIDKENATQIYTNAVKNFRINKRAVTDKDFQDLVELYTKNNQYVVRSAQAVKGNPYTIYVYMVTGPPTIDERNEIADYLEDKTILLDSVVISSAIENTINITVEVEVYPNYTKLSVAQRIQDVIDTYFSALKVGQDVDLKNDIISEVRSVEGIKSFNVTLNEDLIEDGHIAIKGEVTII